jgi:NADH:ubiquinone oxidoreductase subunit H
MGIGISAILLVIGLVLVTGAVNLPTSVTDHVATNTVGWICVIVAVIGFAIALLAGRNRNSPPQA